MHASFANIPFSCRVASVRLKNRLLYIHPGNIVLILKILKKNVVSLKKSSDSENKERFCKKKCSHMRVLRAVTRPPHLLPQLVILLFFFKYCFSSVSHSILIRGQRELHVFRLPSFNFHDNFIYF